MINVGAIFLLISAINIVIVSGEANLAYGILFGFAGQLGLTIISMLLSAFLIHPFLGACGLSVLAYIGCQHIPAMSVTFICTAIGVSLIMFDIPNTESK